MSTLCQRGKPLGTRAIILLLLTLFHFSNLGARGTEDNVEAFKRFLSTPGCFSKIIFSEATCNDVVSRTYHAGWCDGSFFLRQLSGFENINLPISTTNRNRSPLYVGSLVDTRWQIAGYKLSMSIQPNVLNPDGYAAMSDSMQIFTGAILSFGSQHVQPGTFVWSGNKFRAEASQLGKRYGYSTFFGEIAETNGFVSTMTIEGSGTWSYRYGNDTKLPVGVPSEIITPGTNNGCVKKFIIRELVTRKPDEVYDVFDPTRQIEPAVTVRSTWSNSLEIVKAVENPLVTAMVVEEVGRPRGAGTRRVATRVVIVGLLAAMSLAFLTFARRKLPKDQP